LTELSVRVLNILPSSADCLEGNIDEEGFTAIALLSQIAPKEKGIALMEIWAEKVRKGAERKQGIGESGKADATWNRMVRFFVSTSIERISI
jgi:hypothetical protein